MICQIHNKEMKQSSKGWYCSTPIERNPDGSVAKWCDFKPSKGTEVQEVRREPIPQRDYDAENRGKVRNNLVEALIGYRGLQPLSESEKFTIDALVEYVMDGK